MNRNELYICGEINRKPTVERLLKGFVSRLVQVILILGWSLEIERAFKQFLVVKRCQGKSEQTNGKLWFNLFQSSAKLNDQLLELERQARYHGECETCLHQKHDAGLCDRCNCGDGEVIRAAR